MTPPEPVHRSKFRNLLRLTYMIGWRVFILAALLGFSVKAVLLSSFLAGLVSGVVATHLGYSLTSFPLISRLMGHSPLEKLTSLEEAQEHNEAHRRLMEDTKRSWKETPLSPYPNEANWSCDPLAYRPNALANVVIPSMPQLMGNPGAGLGASNFSDDNVKMGQMGEANFAKALMQVGILPSVVSYWSIAMPQKERLAKDTEITTDIDCILEIGHNLFLIDLKQYRTDVTYYSDAEGKLLAKDDKGAPVEIRGHSSRNMSMAKERFLRHKPYRVIRPMVIFMPNGQGEPRLDGVYWPGGVPAYTLSQALEELHQAAVKDGAKSFKHRDESIKRLLLSDPAS